MNHISEAIPGVSIGAAVRLQHSHSTFFVAGIEEAQNKTFIVGAKMKPIRYVVKAVSDDLVLLPDSNEHSIMQVLEKERWKTPEEVAQMVERAEAKTQMDRNNALTMKMDRDRNDKIFYQDAEQRMPSDARAVIVATHHVDDSDSQTDYHGHKSTRTVILAFSTHTRDLFPELRKAARNFGESAFLADGPEDWDHRERYSMGAGYYLKDGHADSTGWCVQKRCLAYKKTDAADFKQIPVGEWSLPTVNVVAAPVAKPSPTSSQATGAHIEQHVHTKHGFDMFLVVMDDRVSKDEFMTLRHKAEAMQGWYSRAWGNTPGGFAFKEQPPADSFLSMYFGGETTYEAPAKIAAPAPVQPKKNLAQKLNKLADGMQVKIDDSFRDRPTHTAKMMAQARHSELEGHRLTRTQAVLRKLAQLHDTGQVPSLLQRITSKSAVLEHMGSKVNQVSNGYHGYTVETGEPGREDETTLALWALIKDVAPKYTPEEQELKQMIDGLQFSQIPGYFPTPPAVIEMMLDYADVKPDHDVLEPNGGSGAIVDAVAKLVHSEVFVYEVNHTLYNILKAKKNCIVFHHDFLEQPPKEEFDRVIANPPFEKQQDIAHVQHAFKFLNSGGRLVSVMSPGAFFRSDKKSQEFRDWFEELGGEKIDLPEESFKSSGTNISTVMVVIDKQ